MTETFCPDGGIELRIVGVVMTSTYAVGIRSWHSLGGAPALTSVPACGECIADHDGDGLRVIPDIFAFIADFMSNNPRADVDGFAGIGVPDIFAFLSAWFAGC
jgi:hypothetical protein